MTYRWAIRLLLLTTVAVLAPACGKGKGHPPSSVVTISSITAAPPTVSPGGAVVLTAAASDSAGGPLSYAWTAPSGSFSSSSGNPVTWTAPLSTGTVLIQLTVTSATNSSATAVVGVPVSTPPPGAIITSVNPPEAYIGDEIQVTGSGFGGVQGGSSLTISGVATAIVLWSDTLIKANVPPGATSGAVVALVAGIPSTPGSIIIDWPTTNPQNLPICTAAGGQIGSQIVSDGFGGAIIVWQDSRNGIDLDIYAQRVNKAGVLQWTVNGVAICSAAAEQSYLQLASDGSGGAIIAWQDYRGGATPDIYAQRVNGAGVTQWTTNGVAVCTAANTQASPLVVSDGSGGAIIVWPDQRSGNYDVYAQRLNNAGAPQWPTDGVPVCAAIGDQWPRQAVSDGSGGVIVVWEDLRVGPYSHIYSQRMNGAGAAQWTTDGVAVCTAAFDQTYPQLVSDGSNGAIVVWMDHRGGTDYHVYAQRVGGAGAVQWTTDGVAICTAANNQYSPAIVSDGAGGAIMAWHDGRGTNFDIFAQRMDGAGMAQWPTNGVAVCTEAHDQNGPQLASDGSGGAILVWTDGRGGANMYFYSQRVSSAGAMLWTIDGVALCTAIDVRVYPHLASDGAGGAIMVWPDARSGNYDIYAQGISANGRQ
jgi:hypothetical protein